VKAARGK